MTHSFDVELAMEIGVFPAILVRYLQGCLLYNKANEKHFHDGHYWSYNSFQALAKLFPYRSKRQIKQDVADLQKKGILLVGNYNKLPMDRTNWYAFADENRFLYMREYNAEIPQEVSNSPKCENCTIQSAKTAPSIVSNLHNGECENCTTNTNYITQLNNTDSKENIYTKESEPKNENFELVAPTPEVEKEKSCAKKEKDLWEREQAFRYSLTPYLEKYGDEMITNFADYWTEPNQNKTKMRFEMQPTFEVGRRLATWNRNNNKQINTHNNGQNNTQQPSNKIGGIQYGNQYDAVLGDSLEKLL